MTQTMTAKQFATAAVVLALATVAKDGQVSEYAARTGGARVDALNALVRKGVLVRTYAPFVMPVGPYAGQAVSEAHYAAAE